MRDEYPRGLPSDHSLRANLIKRGFNPGAIDAAVRAYLDTMAFVASETEDSATLSTSEDWPSDETSLQPSPMPSAPIASTVSGTGHRSVTLPLSVSEWATLQAAFPLSEAAWDQMIAVLNVMKPALVSQPDLPDTKSSVSNFISFADRKSSADEDDRSS